jgi:hypothetical protein
LGLLIALSSCDNSTPVTSPTDGVVSAKAGELNLESLVSEVSVSLIPASVDDAFLRVTDRYPGFAGVYQNEGGSLVVVTTTPEAHAESRHEILEEVMQGLRLDDRARELYRAMPIEIEAAEHSFAELATYKYAIEQNLFGETPIIMTDADERANVVRVGVDEDSGVPAAEIQSMIEGLGIPSRAVQVELSREGTPAAYSPGTASVADAAARVGLPNSLTVNDLVRPLAGGLQIFDNGTCTLGVPVWHGNPGSQSKGFLTASHCTYSVGYNDGVTYGQPHISNGAIGIEFEDPPLKNCGPGSSNCEVTDAVLIDMYGSNSGPLETGVYLTDFSSSTGYGGFAVTGDPIPLTPKSFFVGEAVNKVGRTTGWTTGNVTDVCVTNYVGFVHPDGVERSTKAPCYTKTDIPVRVGDSGAALFSTISDPNITDGFFGGILSYCDGCEFRFGPASYFVPWSSINSELTTNVAFYKDDGGL